MRLIKSIFILMLSVYSNMSLALADSKEISDNMKNAIKKIMKTEKMAGLSVALVNDQGVIWSQGFGFSDKENNIRATEKTIYRAGSITKLLTATAVMQLQEQELLDLTAPLKRYLPQFSIKTRHGNIDQVTLANIMTHHSGLPTDYIDGMWSEQAERHTKLVEYLDDEYLAFPADFIYCYSNIGYSLLGHAVENISQKNYENFITDNILIPLGMTNSTVEAMISGAGTALGYSDGKLMPELPLRDVPAGGLNTNVIDMSHFIQMVLNNGTFKGRQLLSKDSLLEMTSPKNEGVPLDFNFRIGYGWHYYDEVFGGKDIKAIGHSGGTITHHSDMIILPEENLGVIVMSNGAASIEGVRDIAEKIIVDAYQRKSNNNFAKKKYIPKIINNPVPQQLSGTYMMSTLGAAYVENKKNAHQFFFESLGLDLTLKPNKNSSYMNFSKKIFGFIPVNLQRLGEVGFRVEEKQGYQLIVANDNGTEIVEGYRYTPKKIEESWLNRIGEYQLLNQLETDKLRINKLVIEKKWDSLIIKIHAKSGSNYTAFLDTIDSENSVVAGLGRAAGYNLLAFSKGDDQMIRMTGLLFKKIQ